MDIQIVPAKPEDAEGIICVLYKTWLATYPNKELGITKEEIDESYRGSFTDENIEAQQEKIKNTHENQKRFVAKQNNLVIGLATIIKNEDNNQLRTIYVLPEFQGKGIGTKLWGQMRKFSDPTKATVVRVATYSQQAIDFYRSLGFIDTGKREMSDQWRVKKQGMHIPEMEMIREPEML